MHRNNHGNNWRTVVSIGRFWGRISQGCNWYDECRCQCKYFCVEPDDTNITDVSHTYWSPDILIGKTSKKKPSQTMSDAELSLYNMMWQEESLNGLYKSGSQLIDHSTVSITNLPKQDPQRYIKPKYSCLFTSIDKTTPCPLMANQSCTVEFEKAQVRAQATPSVLGTSGRRSSARV